MDETVTSRRPKRSTAGNRLQAALAEFKAEDVGVDVEDDVDFVLDKDEEDMFWQDFESTDEEGDQEDVDATAENMLRQEEHRARKTARTHLERITALAHARQAATFNPELFAPEEKKIEKRIRRRVSIGVAVDAETGEVTPLEPGADAENSSAALSRRHSTRTHTVANTSATQTRAKDEVERKQSSAPKRTKSKMKAPTQEELIARALDMEEGNIEEHRNYLTIEEEKRRKARVVRTSVNGPLLRWVSKAEETAVQIDPGQVLPPEPSSIPRPPVYPATYPATPSTPAIPTGAPGYSYTPATTAYLPPPQASPFQQWPPPPPVVYQPLPPPLPLPPPPPPEPIIRREKVAKQYVVHELEQTEKAARPTWSNTMTAMFGDHADWEHMRVYTTKGRPLSRPTQICPITGKPARYLDPRTNVPYADLEAYRVLSGVLRHEYVWSPILGCYVSREGSVFANTSP
ncbi:YL1 nuclear protein-domain-containing protein [Cubamyces lactineus]|nr:YL1 nuclear protein-domain-containing protein [Cubamyces lactineus]